VFHRTTRKPILTDRSPGWPAVSGLKVDRCVREIGSGLNDKRRELAALLADPNVDRIVVEHRDRLARCGVAQLKRAMSAATRAIVIVEPGEVDDDLVRDMIDPMTCFSARLYGRGSARNRAQRALDALKS
jgi:putative resolvase